MKKIFYLHILLAFTFISSKSSAQSSCAYTYTSLPQSSGDCMYPKPCGIYIIHSVGGNPPSQSYKQYASYYDGIFIRLRWDEMEPGSQGNYNTAIFNELKAVIDFAITQTPQKQISIAIVAGNNTPSWLPASCFINTTPVKNISQFGNSTGVLEFIDRVPAPWDHVFQDAFYKLVDHLYDELTASSILGPQYLDYITMIKLTGITKDSEETWVLNEDDSFFDPQPPYTCATDMVEMWSQNSYTPANLIDAWEDLAQIIYSHFPDKYLNIAVIDDPHAFPPIDCNGIPMNDANNFNCAPTVNVSINCLTMPGFEASTPGNPVHENFYSDDGNNICVYNVTQELISKACSLYSPCLAINSTSLNTTSFPNSVYPMNESIFANLATIAVIGYQQHHQDYTIWPYWDWKDFLSAIQNGLDNKGTFFELHENTIHHFSLGAGTFDDPTGCPWDNVMQYVHYLVHCNCIAPLECVSPCDGQHERIQNSLSFSSDKDVIHITNNGDVGVYHFTINDVAGRQIVSEDISLKEGKNEIVLKQFKLTPDIYLLNVKAQNGNTVSYKLFIKK